MNNTSTIFSNELTEKQITRIIVEKNKNSETIMDMNSADNYFNNDNEVIRDKKRIYYDRERKPIENPNAHNAKIKNNFLRMLVQQKQDYAFSKSFIFKLSDENENEIDLKENDYGKEWKKFLDKSLFKLAYILGGQAINHGISWCYVWIDDNGELKISDVPSNLIYPLWKNKQHTELDRLVYNYTIDKYETTTPKTEEYAEYWSENDRILFNVSNDYEMVNSEESITNSHMITQDNEGVSWGKIPFICMKGTSDEKTLLSFIKEQIDSYDVLSSKSVDGILDDLDPLLVLKGISPDVRDLLEAREIAKMTRTISLDTDGDAHYIQAQTAIDSHLKEIETLRRDIIKFGYGVDYEDSRFGGNPNQLVIKSLYQNIDTYTDGLERHFQNFIDDLKYFFDKWYEFTNRGNFNECQKYTALVKFDRSMMINQSSQIDDCVKLANTGVSKKTQLEFNPVVQDVELELERISEEQNELMNNDLFNFAQKTNIENGGEFNPDNSLNKE